MQNDSSFRPLDIDAVRAFTLVAELASFTRAAQVAGTTQSAVSLKLKRLEERLTTRLVERTPRSVRLTAEGEAFLERARDLLAAHDRALAGAQPAERRLTIGISDHVAGPDLPGLIARVNAFDPALLLDVRIDFSHALLDKFDRAELDAVIVRREGTGVAAKSSWRTNSAGSPRRISITSPARSCAWRCWRRPAACGPCDPRARQGERQVARSLHRRRRDRGGRRDQLRPCGRPARRRIAPPGTLDVGRSFALPPLGARQSRCIRAFRTRARRAALRTAAAFRSMAAM